MDASKRYPVHERFHTFQGEGVFLGMHAFFIRFYGCPLHCPWCDSAGTWHPDYVPGRIEKLSVAELVAEVSSSGAPIVVLTGGEPAIHDLTDLVDALHLLDKRVHIETSGAFPIKGRVDWITLSPKRSKPALPEVIQAASEFKFIIETPEDIEHWTSVVDAQAAPIFPASSRYVWLHPEWGQRSNQAVLSAITEAVKLNRRSYRAGWQMHKLYRADTLDKRSAQAVPLGGDPSRGY